CDDMSVLLACLEVKDCEVVKVCNLERNFVLTAVALRYWLPIERLGDVIEEICCMTERLEFMPNNRYISMAAKEDFAINRSFYKLLPILEERGVPLSSLYAALSSLLV